MDNTWQKMYYDLKADSHRGTTPIKRKSKQRPNKLPNGKPVIMPYTIWRRSCIAWHTPSDTACHQERSL